MDWQAIGRGLAGFGEGYQGRGTEYLQGLQQADARANLAKLGQDMAAGNIDQQQYLKGLAAYNPEIYSKLALTQMGVDAPADVKSWNYMNQLPSDQQQAFRDFRRQQQWLNTGGAFVNPNTGGAIPVTPKPEDMPDFKAQQAEASSGGRIRGETITNAQVGLPDFLARTNNQLSVIDQMIGNKDKNIQEHPGLESAVGGVASKLPSLRDKTIDFEALLEQARSGAFLTSIGQLQGFGALSNEEGTKATDAATRMKTATSSDGFRKAAMEYRDILSQGEDRMKQKASGESIKEMPGSQAAIQAESEGGAPSNIKVSPENKGASKTIGGKTYIQQNGKWYEQ